jgi:transposase
VRRRAIRDRYGRRGRAGDPEYGIKHLLERNLENLSPDNFAKIIDTLDTSAEGQYDWCARHEDIPELITLASTIARWENEIVTAVTTGVTNATAESLNRLAELEARHAYGFRNPANQRRRVRIACTRGTRRPSARITGTTRGVTKRKHHHG